MWGRRGVFLEVSHAPTAREAGVSVRYVYTSTQNLPNLKKGLFLGGQTRHHPKEQDGTAHQFWSLHSIYAYPFDAELPNLTYVVTHMGALFIGGHPGPRRFGATALPYVGASSLSPPTTINTEGRRNTR